MMGEVQLDVESANRFISSLSKSLQALCHGCMDFDAGIEIVGYLNINIDSGSKVDYVLNEKVLKSTTNSMTFVSNSFLAQKEQPKSSKDGSCSPIPELNFNPPQHRSRGGLSNSYPSNQMYKSSGIFSPYSQVLRGSQKRAWSGDWRTSPRKFSRGGVRPPSQNSFQNSSYQSTSTHDNSYTYSNPVLSELDSSASSEQNLYSSAQQGSETSMASDVNIKQEVVEGGNGSSNTDFSNQTGDNVACNVNIKADPDAMPPQEGATDSGLLVSAKSETGEDSFLQGVSNTEGEVPDTKNVEHTKDSSNASQDTTAVGDGAAFSNQDSEDVHEPLQMNEDYDASGDMYPQASFSGEGSSGQFEVIEIDDEDEDVAAMFNDPGSTPAWKGSGTCSLSDWRSPSHSKHANATEDRLYLYTSLGNGRVPYCYWHKEDELTFFCIDCNRMYRSSDGAKAHFKIKHCGTFNHHCKVCGKGFQQRSHLLCHQAVHSDQKQFECNICGLKYAHKTSLMTHIKLTHGGCLTT